MNNFNLLWLKIISIIEGVIVDLIVFIFGNYIAKHVTQKKLDFISNLNWSKIEFEGSPITYTSYVKFFRELKKNAIADNLDIKGLKKSIKELGFKKI